MDDKSKLPEVCQNCVFGSKFCSIRAGFVHSNEELKSCSNRIPVHGMGRSSLQSEIACSE